ncbi:hypothetical protein ACN47A_19745 [Myxococcus fulvus]|uniref:hypothetical protein n=1 Tax=Myxococcus fulvus TaxID=33 RepID=UPI003B9C500B
MTWPTIRACALSCALLGCPEVHRRDGLVDRAAHRDALESIPDRCSNDEYNRYCPEGLEYSDECIERCESPQ